MLKLRNGFEIDVCAAAGALGFDGRGYWWEQPARWLGLLRPAEFTVITKTLTVGPVAGNLRWWCPWRAVRLLPGGGTVNCVGLTNPGIDHWVMHSWPRMRGMKVIVSVMPKSLAESRYIGRMLDPLPIAGIELNDCPNVAGEAQLDNFEALTLSTRHPVGVKLGSFDGWVDKCRALDGKAAWFHLINAVPWRYMFPGVPSPLAKYGYDGSVSGPPIRDFARGALVAAAAMKLSTPIKSGGGVDSSAEAVLRFTLGASVVDIGTAFLRNPAKPNRMAGEIRSVLEVMRCR